MFFNKRRKLEVLEELTEVINKKLPSFNVKSHDDWRDHAKAHFLQQEMFTRKISEALEEIARALNYANYLTEEEHGGKRSKKSDSKKA